MATTNPLWEAFEASQEAKAKLPTGVNNFDERLQVWVDTKVRQIDGQLDTPIVNDYTHFLTGLKLRTLLNLHGKIGNVYRALDNQAQGYLEKRANAAHSA